MNYSAGLGPDQEKFCSTAPVRKVVRAGENLGPRKNSFLRRKMVIARLKSDEERVILGTVLSLPHKNVIRSL